jgi:uncharacterized protein YodC (DUF2158 family)
MSDTKLNIVFGAKTATITYNNFQGGTGIFKSKRIITKASIKDVTQMKEGGVIEVAFLDGTSESLEYTWFNGYNSATELFDAFVAALES